MEISAESMRSTGPGEAAVPRGLSTIRRRELRVELWLSDVGVRSPRLRVHSGSLRDEPASEGWRKRLGLNPVMVRASSDDMTAGIRTESK